MSEPITGVAAGVPYTALPPSVETDALIITWHMLDAPRSDAAFAAALPMAGVPAWRVHLGMPFCGARMLEGGMAAAFEFVRSDPMMAYVAAFVRQAVEEFPAALAELRSQLKIDDGPFGVLGGSLGGAVAQQVMASTDVQFGALVNPAVRARSVIGLIEAGVLGHPYEWNERSTAAADELDFVTRAGEIGNPLLVVSGADDFESFQQDAADLVDALGAKAELAKIAGLAHPLAEEPGIEPSPQWPTTKLVDDTLTRWFTDRLG